MPENIALVRLGSRKKGLTPIEDDNKKGKHYNSNTEFCGPGQYYWWLHVEKVYAYRHDLGKDK